MLKSKNLGKLIKRNSKMVCSRNMLRARTFCACRKFLRARCAHVYKRARNFETC